MMIAHPPQTLNALGTLPLIFDLSKLRHFITTDRLKAFNTSHLEPHSE
jgi:hypothetical protein